MTSPSTPSPSPVPGGGGDAQDLLRKLLWQAVIPVDEPEDCDACVAMVEFAATVRHVSPPSAGSDLCPWHGGANHGRRVLLAEIRELGR